VVDRHEPPDGPPPPKAVGVELVQDLSRISSPVEGFLRRHRYRLKTILSDGTCTDVYVADVVDREPTKRDAIAVAVFARDPSGVIERTRVLLRRQVRYAAYLITHQALATELVAGLLEGEEAPEAAAARELWEEVGLELDASRIRRLGPPYFVLPGVLTERVFPVAAEVPLERLEAAAGPAPPGEGPFEEGAEHVVMTIAEAYRLIDGGPASPDGLSIADSKTELVLGRLWRRLDSEDPPR
jgi:ADP-ribose pyrophosphatase